MAAVSGQWKGIIISKPRRKFHCSDGEKQSLHRPVGSDSTQIGLQSKSGRFTTL